MPVARTHASILSATSGKAIDPVLLQRLEQSFRAWAESSPGRKRRVSRTRILLVFLIIRFTGARLNEVLTLRPADIDRGGRRIRFRKGEDGGREVQIPEPLARELDLSRAVLSAGSGMFKIDAAHVRRKFYECAEAAGIPRELGTPEAIRKARAVELMQSDVPLPVVQRILGHSTPNLAASYVEFSQEDMQRVERVHLEREARRRTSARNRFYGKIERVQRGDVQAGVELASLDGQRVTAVITQHSREQLGLRAGSLIAAEVKAPWVVLYKGEEIPRCTAENRFKGSVVRIVTGRVNSEIVVRISDTTELCSVLTENSRKALRIEEGDTVWAVFSAAAVVLHVD